ncbi:uncharacterized protein LOC127720341 [Mytilus californianus]|uniref:uncharacterized protein LOC127720341 n=1 Tax=Mytilus californianus TaxID=6549 RepID=UPI0022467CEB|nr:uncharacterized protein LOC127720341 [Mytilus californianus]XP_052082879.1 uncharacterized protein LOC127720341 [Mytilus californianus]
MASSLPMCDICMTDNITKSASVWCSECEEAICKDCERQHGRMGLTKNHKIIPIKDYQQLPISVAAIKQKCIRHSLKFDFYCVIHNEPCCVSCVAEIHGTCQKLKPLSEVVGGVKSSAAFTDLEDRTKDISAVIGDLIREKQNNRASFGVQKNKILSEVQNFRTAINNHLLKLENDLLDKLDNMEKKQNGNIDSFIEKLSEMRNSVENINNDLEKIKIHVSNFQAFLCIHEWNNKIETEEKEWMFLQTDQTMDTFDLHMEFTPLLTKFEKEVKELGKIDVKSSSSKKILLKKKKQGQIMVPVSNTVDNIKLTKMCSFQTPDGVSNDMLITGIDVFDDGRIVLADYRSQNKRLIIMNPVGQLIKTITFKDQCYDVAVIEKDTVATTLVFKKEIVIVDVTSSKVQRSMPTSHRCYGISYTGEQLVVNINNKSVQFFDVSGNAVSSLSIADIFTYCSVFNDQLYYTKSKVDEVYSIDLNGIFVWKYECQKSDNPTGITNDASGNVFVTHSDSHQVLVLGKDGKQSRIFLTKEDGLQYPRAIHCNRKNNTLLVCNEYGKCFMYKVTN